MTEQARPHRFAVRVYYEDTDFSGLVYHANYLKFCERARTEMLREAGVSHRALLGDARVFVVRSLAAEFLKPALIDDLLTVETRGAGASGARIILDQRVLRGVETLFTAAVTIVLISADRRPQRIPPDMLATFRPA